jgi:hypothetical protein
MVVSSDCAPATTHDHDIRATGLRVMGRDGAEDVRCCDACAPLTRDHSEYRAVAIFDAAGARVERV